MVATCINAQSGEQTVRLKRSLQENQAKSRVGCAYGNRVSSCFALRHSVRHSWYISRFCVGHIIANAFKDLSKSTVVTLNCMFQSLLLFYDRGFLLEESRSVSEDLVDRYLCSLLMLLNAFSFPQLLLLSAMCTRAAWHRIYFYSLNILYLKFGVLCGFLNNVILES